jgi:cell shape-determining protein MreC
MDRRFKNFIIILSGIILLVSIGYSNGGRTSVTIVENITSTVIVPVQSFLFQLSIDTSEKINDVSQIWENKEKIRILEKENNLLNQEIVKLTLNKLELEELNNLVETAKQYNSYIELNWVDYEEDLRCLFDRLKEDFLGVIE